LTYVLLIIGFALLIKGADYFVEGASKIAALLRVPPLLVGLTIVAFGTSSPEATVSIIAALEGSSDVSLGNVIGSNIFNITLVVGITALINPLSVETTTIRKEIPFTMLASVALAVLANDIALQATGTNLINRSDGIILLLFFIIFLYYIIEVAINNREQVPDAAAATAGGTWGKNILFTLAGLAAIIFGGDLVVDNENRPFRRDERNIGRPDNRRRRNLPAGADYLDNRRSEKRKRNRARKYRRQQYLQYPVRSRGSGNNFTFSRQ
jgi:cation:H+ antiporter